MSSCVTPKVYKPWAAFPWLETVAFLAVLSPSQVCPRSGDSVRELTKDHHPILWCSSEMSELGANPRSQSTLNYRCLLISLRIALPQAPSFITGFSSPDIICTVICSGSLGMQLDCWHLVPRANAVNVSLSCMDAKSWSVLTEEPNVFYLGSQILNVFSERYPVFTEKSQFSSECLTLSCCFWISVLELNGQKCQNQTFLGTGTFMPSKEQL